MSMDILKVFSKKKIQLKTLVYTELPDNAKIIGEWKCKKKYRNWLVIETRYRLMKNKAGANKRKCKEKERHKKIIKTNM